MALSIIELIGSQPLMRVIKGLFVSSQPRHLRSLAAQYSLSPAGVSDILRRLIDAGVITETWQGNRRCFALKLSPEERSSLEVFFKTLENTLLEKRSLRFSKNAAKKLTWIDESYSFYRGLKKSRP